MRQQIKAACWAFAFFALSAHKSQSANETVGRWQTISLMRNEVVAARLHILRECSAADKDWIVLEMENLTDKPLSIQQTWLGLEAEWRDLLTDKPFATGDLTPGNVFSGLIKSDILRTSSNTWQSVSCNLGRPPRTGIKIVAKARLHLMTDKGPFESPACGVVFNWLYPDMAGIATIKTRLKELLRNPRYQASHAYELQALLAIPEAAEDLSVDELLSAVKCRQNSVDGRDQIISFLGRRFADDSKVIAFVSEDLKRGKLDDVGVTSPHPGIWNPAFVPMVVDCFERNGDSSALRLVLGPHRPDWASDPQVVKRLSAALLVHRPLLAKNVNDLPPNDLFAWSAAAAEAAIIGDKGLLKFLIEALDDQRMAIYPQERQVSFIPVRKRVCDHALDAIGSIMGISVTNEYGLRLGETGYQPEAAVKRAIADLKRRISALHQP